MILGVTPMITLSGAEVAAWVTVIVASITIVRQVWASLKKRNKEKAEIESALSHAPEVRKQLELGNVGEAVKHLNVIIETQSKTINSQAERLNRYDGEIENLKDRLVAAETEAEGWEKKYNEEVILRHQDKKDSDRQIEQIKAQLEEAKRTFARTLSEVRLQIQNQDPGGQPDL